MIATAPSRGQLLEMWEVLYRTLSPVCVKMAYAGGLRRGKEDPHDMEIVVLPVWDTDLFGERTESHFGLDLALEGLIKGDLLRWDTEVKRDGERYKRFVMPSLGNFVLEMFFADELNYGNILTIRTGNADWSRLMMTDVEERGLMPSHLQQIGGYLRNGEQGGAIVPCYTERSYFSAIGVPWVAPRFRHIGMVNVLRKELNY